VVFSDDGNRPGVLRPIAAAAFAVVVVGVGVEAGARVVGIAFGSFFGFGGFFFGLSRFGRRPSFGLTLFTSLPPLHGAHVGSLPCSAFRSTPQLTGALALLAQFGSFPSLLNIARFTRPVAFVRSASGSHRKEGQCDNPDYRPAHKATIGATDR